MSTASELQSLLDEVREQFDITCDHLSFGDYTLDCYRPTDPESILDEETLLASHGQLDWQPYWAQAWDAGIGLCHYMSTQPIAGLNILDLGCGVGLTSALLLAAGAHVVCGDNAPPALSFARINTWPWRHHAGVQLIDWHKTRLNRRFDIIVGADILYDRGEVEPLDRFFTDHLKPAGHVLLSDPSRPMTREYLQSFQQRGWELQEQTQKVDGARQPTRLVSMRANCRQTSC